MHAILPPRIIACIFVDGSMARRSPCGIPSPSLHAKQVGPEKLTRGSDRLGMSWSLGRRPLGGKSKGEAHRHHVCPVDGDPWCKLHPIEAQAVFSFSFLKF